jgi:hypothetical protein
MKVDKRKVKSQAYPRKPYRILNWESKKENVILTLLKRLSNPEIEYRDCASS